MFGDGFYEIEGKKHEFFVVNLATIDQPQEGIDLSEWKMSYCDGLTNNWMDRREGKPFNGGLL